MGESKNYAIHNGELLPEHKAVIPISDKAYFFDFAVYSSLKVIKGKVFFPEYHIERLFDSAKQIELKHTFKKNEVVQWINKLAEKNKIKDSLLRMLLIGDPSYGNEANLYIFPVTGVTYYPQKFYSKGIKAITYKGERRFPTAKTVDLLLGFLALREAKMNNAFEALLVDSRGRVREGTRSNIFAVKGNTVITPAKSFVVEGITRKFILKVLEGNKDFEVKEEDIYLSKIKEYDEIFISSTLMNAMPVRQINDYKIESEFPKTKKILKLFKDYYRKNVLE